MRELVREGVREWFKCYGPQKQLTHVQPIRPVAPTGQTGRVYADRSSFDLLLCHVSLNLMTMIKLTIED